MRCVLSASLAATEQRRSVVAEERRGIRRNRRYRDGAGAFFATRLYVFAFMRRSNCRSTNMMLAHQTDSGSRCHV